MTSFVIVDSFKYVKLHTGYRCLLNLAYATIESRIYFGQHGSKYDYGRTHVKADHLHEKPQISQIVPRDCTAVKIITLWGFTMPLWMRWAICITSFNSLCALI